MTSIMNYPATSRRVRSLRIRGGRTGSGRSEHGEDNIPLDLDRDPNDILKEILTSVSAQQGVTTARKLGHLNNFVKLFCSIPNSSLIEIPLEVIMTCLKATLVSDVKEVRAAGVRALRYLINDDQAKQIFSDLKLDYLVTKCIDISHFNEVERIQAVRLVRKMAHLKRKRASSIKQPIVPLPLIACIVSVSLDGAEERDRVYRTCLAVLCELALLQPRLVIRCNGVLALINGILECHMYQRINECLCLSLMHIINHPSLVKWHEPLLDMSPTFAPFTELNYRLHPDVDDSKLRDELEMRFQASKMAIVSLLRTWSGLLHICHSKHMIKSFVEALLIPNDAVRQGILSVLCELFYFNELQWTDDFEMALNSAAPGNFKDNWRISEGFVVAEGKSLLPVRCVSRPDLVDSHLSIILSCFLRAGLLEALSRVAISPDSCSSVGATIVLGLTLHLASHILPENKTSSMWRWHLPELLKSSSPDTTMEETLRINVTVKRLQEVHLMRNNPPKPHSLYLSQLVSATPHHHDTSPAKPSPSHSRSRSQHSVDGSTTSFAILRRNRSLNLIRDFTGDLTLTAIKNTKVLTTKDYRTWDWEALQCLFLTPPSVSFLRGVGADDMLRRFYRRLIYFYLPSSKIFSALDLAKDGKSDENRKYVQTACYMVPFLSSSDDEGQRLLKNLINDILESLPKVNTESANYSKASGSLAVTCSREYFLILGTLSCHPKADQILDHCKVYEYFMGIACEDTHENHIRLLVSSLHYCEGSPARMVLCRVLTTCNEPSRLYATGFLRILLRSNCPGFQRWGTELLTTQLFDKSNDVAAEALDILHEACDDRDYLHAVVKLRPTLLHLGERGAILVCRFMSEPQGFAYLSHNNYLDRELKRWWTEYNERYVLHVEELLKLSLTTFERTNKEDGFVRRSSNKKTRQSVYLPAHLYGELCRHEAGARLIEREDIASLLTDKLKQLICDGEGKGLKKELPEEKYTSLCLKIKSCLWALAHIGSTVYGLPILERCEALPIFTSLACVSPITSIRGTCVYCLCAIGQTIPGVEALRELGYQSVLEMVNKSNSAHDERQMTPPQPIVTPRMSRLKNLGKSISSSAQWSTASSASNHRRKSPQGSLSNMSLSSDATPSSSHTGGSKKDRISRSRTSSRAASDAGSSFKKKSRQENRHSLQDESSIPVSPSNATLSTSNLSSRSSVFDGETSNNSDANLSVHATPTISSLLPGSVSSSLQQRDIKTPSPASTYEGSPTLKVDYNRHKHKRPTLPSLGLSDRRTKTVVGDTILTNTAPKPKLKDRFFDLFSKKSRSRSVGSGSISTQSSRGLQNDDTSSGYVSDQIASVEVQEHRSNDLSEPESVRLPTQINVVHSSRMVSSITLTSSSNNSIDTLKTGDATTIGDKSPEELTSSLPESHNSFPAKTRDGPDGLDTSEKDGTRVSRWNTNNSGQSSSMLSDNSLERPRAKSQFYPARNHADMSEKGLAATDTECPEFDSEGETKRCQSLPDVLDGNTSPSEPLFRTLSARKLKSQRATIHFVSTSHSNEELSSSYKEHGPVAYTNKITVENSVKTEADETKTKQDNIDRIIGSLSPEPILLNHKLNVPAKAEIRKQAEEMKTELKGLEETQPTRARGNTGTSQDSGVGVDSSSPILPKADLRGNSPKIRVYDDVIADFVTSEVSDENQWRLSKPEGLAAIRLLKQKQHAKSSESRHSIERATFESEILSSNERDDIIKCTRYVGIVVPDALSDLFKPSSKCQPRKSSLSPASLLKDGLESDARTETTEGLHERKISTVRQAPKFRGLDESTFGAAVTAGIMQAKSGKMQSIVTTPFARTPDSILSETSDLCYIGGQLVEPGSDEYIAFVHEEIIQLVVNLASSVGMKAHETSLLMMKEKRPEVFNSISLYSSIVEIMSEYSFRLTTRRFVQELFQDVKFTEVYQEAHRALQSIQ